MNEVTDEQTADRLSLALLRRYATEQGRIAISMVRWIALGTASGLLAGGAGWVFLTVLDHITNVREGNWWLYLFLPAGGFVLSLIYHYWGGRARGGSPLIIEQIHRPTDWVPRRMAPFIVAGTWGSQLIGASVGREGTALQMSGSLTDGLSRILRLREGDRRIMLIAALGGGFGAVFGVPVAGAIFALEVQMLGRVRYDAIVPTLTASVVGHLVVTGLRYRESLRLQVFPEIDTVLLLKLVLAGALFGLAGAVFVELTDQIKAVTARHISFPPLRTALGGVALVLLVLLTSREYLGMSLGFIDRSLGGEHLSFAVFALKILVTAISIGCLFPGGEVTPLFCIGATLGSALALPLGVEPRLMAAVGYVAVFAGASNAPLACTVLGIETFGARAAVPFVVACVVSYVFSGHRSIYPTQRMSVNKFGGATDATKSVHEWSWWND